MQHFSHTRSLLFHIGSLVILITSMVFALPANTHAASASCANTYIWKPLRIGGGGWLTDINISNDGKTRVVRADTYGAYIWNNNQWRQLVASHTMPASDIGVDMGEGVYEIRVAPSDSNRLYMAYRGYVYTSEDRGARWIRTSFTRVDMYPNDAFRVLGEKMAIDPANPDIVYVGTPKDGLFFTRDGGDRWTSIADIPKTEKAQDSWPGITGIVFDPSTTSQGTTTTIYASSHGQGVWRSTDAGTSWTKIPGGPNSVTHATVSPDGTYYATDNDSNTPNRVWKLTQNTWTQLTPPRGHQWQSVTISPQNASHIVLVRDSGHITQSFDAGATWSDVLWSMKRHSPDIPWLAWTNETYMSNGNAIFDPHTPNELWFAQGIGVWTTKVLPNDKETVWASKTKGIEQLVANAVIAPPGGKPVMASWDRALFTSENPDAYPTKHGPSAAFNAGWSVDYASTNPSFLAAIVTWGKDESGYSTDKGKTWTKFTTAPPQARAGAIAVSTPTNIVWLPSNKSAPYYTKDRGKTWHEIVIPGVTDSRDGLHWAQYLNRRIVAADRVTPNTFYLYHTPTGLYRSQDGGATWSRVYKGEIVPFSGFNVELKAMPDRAGHLFFTVGHQSGDEPAGDFMESTDGGKTWKKIPNVREVYTFDFGKPAPGNTAPSIYIVGWVYGEYGIWRSDTKGVSWARIGKYPLGSLDQIKTLAADKTVYGKVYLGFQGSGYAYGTTTCTR